MSGAVFLKLEGIDGEATDDQHEKEIDVLSWSWGMSQPPAVHAGAGTSVGKVSVQDLNVVKTMDKASPNLVSHCCSGKVIPTGTLTVQRAGEKKVQALVIELTDILVSSYQTGGGSSDGTLPADSLTLSFKTFMYKYSPQKEDGSADSSIDKGWDIAASKEK